MEFFNQKKFGIIFDNFDKTSVNKNVGLFAQYLAKRGISVSIITNKTKYNKNVVFATEKIELVRLPGLTTWPPLNHSSLKQYFAKNLGNFFAIWLYRGRPYTSWIMEMANDHNLLTLVKLDSSGGISILFSVLSKVIKPESTFYNLIARRFKFLSNLNFFRWFILYDIPLIFSSIILCETPTLMTKMKKYFGGDKSFLYPNCLPVSQFKRIEKSFYQKGLRKKKLITAVGRIVPGKGFDATIRAFSKVPFDVRKSWELQIIGPFQDLNYVDELKKLISQLGLGAQVSLEGGLYGNNLYERYFQSEIFLMIYPKPEGTWGFEGQPNVVCEAMFFRNSIVTTNVGTLSYLLANCGVLLSSSDLNSASKAIGKILVNKKLCLKLAQASRARVEGYFNLDEIAAKLFQRIKNLDYSVYLKDQRQDTVVGEYLKGPVFKYCDLLSRKLLKGVDFSKLSIIDVGCREFYTYDYFLEKFKNKIKGIDIGLEGLQFAKRKNVIDLDAHKMGDYFGSYKFDLILAFHVFEHMYDLKLVLKHCNFILKPEGFLYFAVPIPAKNTRRGHWIEIANEDEMVGLCANYGFQPVFHKVYPPGVFRDEKEMLGLFQKS